MQTPFRLAPLARVLLATSVLFGPRLVAQGTPATTPILQSGPMVGASQMREVTLWAQTTRPAVVQFVYWDSLAPTRRYTSESVRTAPATAHVAKVQADSVKPGHVYGYELRINGVVVPRPYALRFATPTLWQYRTDPPTVRIAVASCFYVNEPEFDRPGTPYGGDYDILGAVTRSRPDLMLWMGDNAYLREGDFDSRTGVFHRYTHSRSLPELQPLLAATSHYATWDDHDFGPNDSDRSYGGRFLTRAAFELFWGNPPLGADGGGGVTSTFGWSDVDVFLMDNRWYRDGQGRVTGDHSYLGRNQIEWLLNGLKASRATFKLVVIGGQTVNNSVTFENYATYGAERTFLLDRLQQERVPGVIFLTGDKHWTELSKMDRGGSYPLYDLTVSPLTAGPSTGWKTEPNAYRVDGTIVSERNFGLLEVTGPLKERVLTITIQDRTGAVRWKRAIPASELK
ncbi:MAG: alkaline phosphatase family protein [Gemmatimonadetes bacterium]|nr:alkaline phosphatase family protein [Gemmatimonadota bacterium]MBL0180564.1 alkaline phosphatase family protein [Gemmatimonadota bacterium]